MKTVFISYAVISPAVLATIIEAHFTTAVCNWREVDEDYFEFRVYGVADLPMLEDVLAAWV